MNRAFVRTSGVVAPLLMDDVNTDLIIPMGHCLKTPREDMGKAAFESIRYNANGEERSDFILNQEPFHHSPILLVGENFGCGSSREPAVWALAGMGIRVVIGKSFGGIFHANCFRNGMLPISLDTDSHDRLTRLSTQANPVQATVDLELCEIQVAGEVFHFDVEPERREALLAGLDDIGRTLQSLDDILAFQQRDQQARPWVWQPLLTDDIANEESLSSAETPPPRG